MTLQQLQQLKRWHVAHRRDHPVEYHLYDLVLTCWLLGWMGAPAALLLDAGGWLLACALAFLAPPGYVAWRVALHRRGRLRCDWADSL
jgi:hypothetical protein